MKRNLHHSRRSSASNARLSFALALVLWAGGLPNLLAQAVPDRINYQGILLKGDGIPVPAVPTDVEFRIYDTPTLATGLQWGRMFRITPDTNGAFNVILSSEGSLLTGSPDVSLASAFTGTGSDARYLELTVAGSTPIRPRQRFVASPYALLAHDVSDARSDFRVAGVLTVAGPASLSSLTASGAANVGSLTVTTSANVAGPVTAASFVGNGAELTGINTNSLVQQVVEALCPPGTIVAYGGHANNLPPGWLLCDGRSLSRTTYPRLFGAIATNWGAASSSEFNLPDLRGMFLRGVNGARSDTFADPDNASRMASAPGGSINNVVGSLQRYQVQAHTHTYSTDYETTGDDGSSAWYERYGAHLVDTGVTGGSETRPNNAYVNYIIKY